jgi:hypothetical protein
MTALSHETVETPAMKRARKQAEREQAEAQRKEREAAELAELKAKRPAVLFDLQVRLTKLSNAGLEVDVEFVASTHSSEAYDAVDEKEPGLRVLLGRRDRDGYRDKEVYTVASPQWRYDVLEQKLVDLQAEYDEVMRQKSLAEEAKKLLTPEQLAALKQYG